MKRRRSVESTLLARRSIRLSARRSICEPAPVSPDKQNDVKHHCGTTSSTRKAYGYGKLPRGEHFRYLVLQPGVGDEPLQCSLHTALVSEVSFEAISYVWGSDVKDQEILCGGHVVKITTNLCNVLKRVRLPDAPRNLYADGICINQNDQNEKGYQVRLMGKIYRTAERVLIYIGPDDGGHGNGLCSFLDDVYEMFENTFKEIDMSWQSFPYTAKANPLLNDTRWKSLHALLTQDWFFRGWVVQEAGLAQEGWVIWGQSSFSWEKLMKLCCWMDTRAVDVFYGYKFGVCYPRHHTNMYMHRNLYQIRTFFNEALYSPLSSLKTLQDARRLELSNPRDRIYAFMEIFQDLESNMNLIPDYNAPFLEVYQQFAIEYVRATRDIDILDFVIQDPELLYSGMPSWIPRWDINSSGLARSKSPYWPALTSRTQSVSKPEVTEDNNLKVHGVIVDSICYLSDILHSTTTTSQIIFDIWKAINTLEVELVYPVSYQLYAFLNVLCMDGFEGEYMAWKQSEGELFLEIDRKSGKMDMADLPLSTLGVEAGESNVYLNSVKQKTSNQRAFVTERGYIGLCPLIACEGDLCAIIFGSTGPCILRKTDEKETYFKFLGASYISGQEPIEQEGWVSFYDLGSERSKDWIEWDVEEQDIYLC